MNENTNMKGVKFLSKAIKWGILFIITITAFKQIGFRVDLIEKLFLIIVGALAAGLSLALGIGLGLGMRKDAEKFLKDFMKNL